jgi:membrane dipeptidase
VTAPAPIPVVDLHADLLWRIAENPYDPLADAPGEHIDLAKLRRGGAALLGTAIYTPEEHAAPDAAAAYGERLLAILRDLLARGGGALRQVRSRAEVAAAARAVDPRGPALLLTMEGVAPLGTDPAALDRWHALGLRIVGLTHNPRNAAGDGTGVPVAERRGGLTPFGRDLVRRMGELGIVPDIAHLAEEACGGLFEAARGPVVCTHCGVRAVKDHWRNLSDAQIKAVAATGGVVGIDAYPGHVVRGGADSVRGHLVHGKSGTLEDVALHMEHVASLAGPAHVALGLDFGGFDGPTVEGLEDASGAAGLARYLEERGWTREQVEGAFWRNAARVLDAVLR